MAKYNRSILLGTLAGPEPDPISKNNVAGWIRGLVASPDVPASDKIEAYNAARQSPWFVVDQALEQELERGINNSANPGDLAPVGPKGGQQKGKARKIVQLSDSEWSELGDVIKGEPVASEKGRVANRKLLSKALRDPRFPHDERALMLTRAIEGNPGGFFGDIGKYQLTISDTYERLSNGQDPSVQIKPDGSLKKKELALLGVGQRAGQASLSGKEGGNIDVAAPAAAPPRDPREVIKRIEDDPRISLSAAAKIGEQQELFKRGEITENQFKRNVSKIRKQLVLDLGAEPGSRGVSKTQAELGGKLANHFGQPIPVGADYQAEAMANAIKHGPGGPGGPPPQGPPAVYGPLRTAGLEIQTAAEPAQAGGGKKMGKAIATHEALQGKAGTVIDEGKLLKAGQSYAYQGREPVRSAAKRLGLPSKTTRKQLDAYVSNKGKLHADSLWRSIGAGPNMAETLTGVPVVNPPFRQGWLPDTAVLPGAAYVPDSNIRRVDAPRPTTRYAPFSEIVGAAALDPKMNQLGTYTETVVSPPSYFTSGPLPRAGSNLKTTLTGVPVVSPQMDQLGIYDTAPLPRAGGAGGAGGKGGNTSLIKAANEYAYGGGNKTKKTSGAPKADGWWPAALRGPGKLKALGRLAAPVVAYDLVSRLIGRVLDGPSEQQPDMESNYTNIAAGLRPLMDMDAASQSYYGSALARTADRQGQIQGDALMARLLGIMAAPTMNRENAPVIMGEQAQEFTPEYRALMSGTLNLDPRQMGLRNSYADVVDDYRGAVSLANMGGRDALARHLLGM